ncbi:LysR family transcriptional regulator [Pelomonas aquatica]|jgi:DNA-binding transcriptional LysR family regulator|uniref:LysR family transcriptional regulator n=1 Tax=Pelomonas aquatica TaxID=431058 RepID=A0A9X4LE04_9BURK|nr:LysR family transcriptional regulator [Pelomonas aquatica]MCY4755362.1 LysR family transcriptional regulator [Pelomonas aquatica]MDG0861770.1 LysR family transcriptional regulator [Pelomonas aquatica]
MESDADDLLLFARVMDAGSFSRAAERVRWPKSTVSRRIAALETRLGEKLLQRTTRKLSLTDFGAGVLEHARAVAAEVDGALALALHRQSKPSGRLRVSMPADVAQNVAAGMLAEFAIQHPEVQLELDLTPRRVDIVGEGFDLAIRMGDLGEDGQLAARRLATTQWGLYASPAYLARVGEPLLPQALESMHALMLLGRSGEPLPWRLSREGGEAVVVRPAQRTLANAPSLLAQLAEAGVGIAGIDRLLVSDALRLGRLQRLMPQWQLPGSTAWAVFPERRLMPLRTRVFLEAISALLAGCPTPA